MPYRHPIVSVIGRPISVTQNDNPSSEEMYTVQKAYIEELLRIWEAYKVSTALVTHALSDTADRRLWLVSQDVYARNRTRELTIVE